MVPCNEHRLMEGAAAFDDSEGNILIKRQINYEPIAIILLAKDLVNRNADPLNVR
jgi:hypothetical protein